MIHQSTKVTDWVCTDIDENQYGKRLDEKVFVFKQGLDQEEELIDLDKYTDEQKESAIWGYSYTLKEESKGNKNVFDLYGEEANWIIAECIFECNQ